VTARSKAAPGVLTSKGTAASVTAASGTAAPVVAAAVPTADRRSPLGATTTEPSQVAAAPGVEVWELPFVRQLNLRLSPDPAGIARIADAIGVTIPTTPNQVEIGRDVRALWLAPDEWLIVGSGGATGHVPAAPAGEAQRPGTKEAGRSGKASGGGRAVDISEAGVGAAIGRTGASVVDVSAHRTILRLTGPRAAEILAQGCSIDLHPRSFPVGACAQTLLARVDVILERLGAEEFGAFVRASLAPYLADWLRDAMGVGTATGTAKAAKAAKATKATKSKSGRRATPSSTR
jgi:sarcosine oxidase subunit gamma